MAYKYGRELCVSHWRRRVEFVAMIRQMYDDGVRIFVEVGPQQTLTRLNQRTLADAADASSYHIACDNPKRAGIEPLLCVQALLECLGALEPKTPSAQAAAPPSIQVTTTDTELNQQRGEHQSLMEDQIPHFDATQRRREKMRQASAGGTDPKGNGSNPVGVPGRGATPPVAPPAAPTATLSSESTRPVASTPDLPKHDGNGSSSPPTTMILAAPKTIRRSPTPTTASAA